MAENNYIIEIEAGRRPYNSYMVLPISLLQKLAPCIKEEILKGLVGSEDDKVVLYLFLEVPKIKKVEKIVALFEENISIVGRLSA